MSNIQSYNALIDRFHAFASGHFILKRFSHGQIEVSDLEKFGEYPFMHVVPSNVSYAKGMKTFSFQIVLADLPRDKEDKPEYQREVLSDLQRIAEDLVAEITNHRMLFGDLITVQNVSLEPFLEEFQHTLTGWTISLDLLVPYYWDACSIPAEWNDFFESGSGGTGSILTFIDSINRDNSGNVSLVNDEETPAANYYYGTNNAGVRGWYLTEGGGGLTCETIGDCQTIIDIEAAIDDLEEEIVLKADISSISAVGFSNDYNDLDNLPTIPTLTSELTNDSGFITIGDVPAQVNSDWNATSGVEAILNKPTIPSIAGLVPDTRTISTTAPLSGGGDLTANRTLSIPQATTSVDGYLSATDWTTFNSKQAALVSGTNIKTVNGTTLIDSGNVGTGYAGFKYNIQVLTGYPPFAAPASGVAQILFYDNGEGGADYGGWSISNIDANGNYIGQLLFSTFNTQPFSVFTPQGTYALINILSSTSISGGYEFNSNTVVGIADLTTLNNTVGFFNFGSTELSFTAENTANKQNSLAVDGSGLKFPTVDAVNALSFIDKGKRMVSFFTDFLTNATLDGAQSFASGGSLGLIVGAQIPNRTNQQGVAFFQTNVIATNYINYCSSSGAAQLWFGGGAWNYEALININTLSTVLERYRMIFGFGSVTSNSSEANGVFITYDEGGTANGTTASANWQCVTADNSVRTLTTSSTAVTAAAWNKLRIEINAAGTSVTFYVNGTAIATHTTNIPLASNSRYVIMKTGLAKTIGTTTRGFYCDYIGYENILTTAR